MPDMRQLCNRRRFLAISAATTLVMAGCGRRSDVRNVVPRTSVTPVRSPRPAPAPSGLWYHVETGDTLASISRRSEVSVDAIKRANHLRSNLIKPGQRLWLPRADGLHADPLADRLAATGLAGGYTLIPRARWATAGIRSNHRAMRGVNRITVHHTGNHKGFAGKSDREIVRMIDRYHREERRWSSIGYHFIVGRNGEVFEGRPAHIQGAHVSSNNRHNLGVSVIGDFNQRLPGKQQLAALAAFLDDRRHEHGVSRGRIYGHRDLGQTVCPGDRLHAWLQRWKRG